MYSGNLKFLEPSGSLQVCNGIALPLVTNLGWSRWSRGLRHRSAAAHLLRFGFESLWGSGCLSVVCVVRGLSDGLNTHPEESY